MAGVNDLPNAYLLPAITFLSYHSLKYVSKERSSRTSAWACWDTLPAGRPGRGQKDGHLPPRGTHHWTGACHQPQISLQISKLAFANLMQKGQCSLLERWRESSMGRYYLVMDQFFRKVINLSTPGSPLKKTLAQHPPDAAGLFTPEVPGRLRRHFCCLLKQIVNSSISARGILLLLGLFWFSNLSKWWGINSIADFQQHTYTVLLVHAHSLLSWVHSQAKFWSVFVSTLH